MCNDGENLSIINNVEGRSTSCDDSLFHFYEDSKTRHHSVIFVISAPSGTGKTSVIQQLMRHDSHLALSVSATTRSKRLHEVDGRDYFFLSKQEFQDHLDNGDFVEHIQTFGHRYGTLKKEMLRHMDAGKDLLFDVTWLGLESLRAAFPERIVSILLLPPSVEELQRRLQGRKTEVPSEQALRLSGLWDDVKNWMHYDFVVMTKYLPTTIEKVKSIMDVERHKAYRQKHMPIFVDRFNPQSLNKNSLKESTPV